jgi:hypothetical protein
MYRWIHAALDSCCALLDVELCSFSSIRAKRQGVCKLLSTENGDTVDLNCGRSKV